MRQKQVYPRSRCCGLHLLMGEGHHYGKACGREIRGHCWRRQSHAFIFLETVVLCLIGHFPRCPMLQGTHGCHQHGTSGREIFPCRLYRKGQNLCFHFCQFLTLKRQAKEKALLISEAVWRKFSSFTCVKKVKSHYWQSNFNQSETKLTATLVGLYKSLSLAMSFKQCCFPLVGGDTKSPR